MSSETDRTTPAATDPASDDPVGELGVTPDDAGAVRAAGRAEDDADDESAVAADADANGATIDGGGTFDDGEIIDDEGTFDDADDDPPAPAGPELDDEELSGALEAVLLVVDTPVSEQALSTAVGRPIDQVRSELIAMAQRYAEARSGIDLREIGGGWRFYTRDRFASVVERFVLDGQQSRLSRAALETLAVIAYRQPVTRARVAAVRGVNVDGVIRTLVARGLIEEVGTDAETGGLLYRTTELFTERLGLASLEDLPEIGPLLPEVDSLDDV